MKWLFFVIALAYVDTCVQVGKPEFGRIEVVAKDITGANLRDPRIELIEVGSRQSIDATRPVPYGTYDMRIVVPGFRLLRREIHLYQPSLTVRAELSVGFGCGDPPSIRGKLRGAKPGHELWVKTVPSLGIGGAESRVDENGDFLVAGLENGTYILIVMDGNKAIHTETVTTNRSESLTIGL